MLPCGTYPRSYKEDKSIVRTRLQWLLYIAFLALLFAAPLFLPTKYVGMLNMTAIILIAVVGLQITTGYGGQINLGQGVFLGFGAYVTAVMASTFGLPFWLAIPLGGVGAAIFGALFGLPAVRVKGFYLALTTLAAVFIFGFAMKRLPGFGGEAGMAVPAATLGGIRFTTPFSSYYMIMIVTVIMVFFAYGLVRSRVGRAFTAIRDNDNAAEILGINVFYYKTMAFLIGAMFAGIAGGLWAYYFRYVESVQFGLFQSLWYVGMLIVGGMGSILGAIFGTVALRALEEIITYGAPFVAEAFPTFGSSIFAGMNVVLGGVIMLMLIFQPKGLAHRWNIFKASYRLWPFPY
jgi:branched-chain amino acid transport system permease protein